MGGPKPRVKKPIVKEEEKIGYENIALWVLWDLLRKYSVSTWKIKQKGGLVHVTLGYRAVNPIVDGSRIVGSGVTLEEAMKSALNELARKGAMGKEGYKPSN